MNNIMLSLVQEIQELKNESTKSIIKKLEFYVENFDEYAYKANKKIPKRSNAKNGKKVKRNKEEVKKNALKSLSNDEFLIYSRLTSIGLEANEKSLLNEVEQDICEKLKKQFKERLNIQYLKSTNRVQLGTVTEIPYIALMNTNICNKPTESEPYIAIFVTSKQKVFLGLVLGGIKDTNEKGDNEKLTTKEKINKIRDRCKNINSDLADEIIKFECNGVLSKLYDEQGEKIKGNFVDEKSKSTSSNYKYSFICYKYYNIKGNEWASLDDESFIEDIALFIKLYDKYALIKGQKTLLQYSEIDSPHRKNIKEFLDILINNKQIILYGPPGTGKTRMAKMLAARFLNEKLCTENKSCISMSNLSMQQNKENIDKSFIQLTDNDYLADFNKQLESDLIKLVQFHPTYNYNDFVIGVDLDVKNGNMQYGVKAKIFYEFAKKAKDDKEKRPHILIIDEINRAPLSSVLGELLYALEYRGDEITLPYGGKLSIPENLYIIGTMNTADRSIAEIDYAVRRRFSFIEIPPEEPTDLCDKKYAANIFNIINKVFDELKNISKSTYPDDVRIGTSYFIYKDINHLKYKIEYEILPILREYFKEGILNRRAKCEEYRFAEIFDDKKIEKEFIKYLLAKEN